MQLPKLTPLQSRLLASATATGLLLVIWITFQPQNFVYAAELPVPVSHDLSLDRRLQDVDRDSTAGLALRNAEGIEEREDQDTSYAPEFAYFDRSLIGRADSDVTTLDDNEIAGMDISPGDTKYFMFQGSGKRSVDVDMNIRNENDSIEEEEELLEAQGAQDGDEDGDSENELRKRQGGRQVYISANTCSQPGVIGLETDAHPQLKLYVSTSSNNQKPGPDAQNNLATAPIDFVGGYASFSLQTNSDVYIGVNAPEAAKGWTGGYNFDIAVSNEQFYHSYDDSTPFLFNLDTDYQSALFITQNLSTETNDTDAVNNWMQLDPNPFTMYVFPWNNSAVGLENSFCGLKQYFISNTTNTTTPMKRLNVDASMTTRYGGDLPKGQFHVQNLEKNFTYVGYLVMNGSTAVSSASNNVDLAGIGPGGRVWKSFNWTTKETDSCQIIFNLDFCTKTGYAVPSSPKFQANVSGLAALYDNQASAYYQNFSNSLAQIACHTTGTAQYSLARNCTDCENDYRDWLCSVLMPRCVDYNSTSPSGLQERNIMASASDGWRPYSDNTTDTFTQEKATRFAFNQSRNPMIDDEIQPGPYKELLPCEDLCFDIVRSCPAKLQFGCPDLPMRQYSYGRRDPDNDLNLTCNFPGAVVDLNMFQGGEARVNTRVGIVFLVTVVVSIMVSW